MDNIISEHVRFDGSRSAALLAELRSFVGESSPGRLFPSEWAIARKYNVSRSTAGKVLKQLAEEGLIDRQRGRGTLVRDRKIITFLLPCPGFLSGTSNSAIILRQRMQGAMAAAQERNLGFETIAVSRTNNINQMDYSQLARINAGSMVILDDWFKMLFPLLSERRARVALLEKQVIPWGYAQYTKCWHRLELLCHDGVETALDRLSGFGCKQIALISRWILSTRHHPMLDAYQAWAARKKMPAAVFELPGCNEELTLPPAAELRAFYEKKPFDGVLLGYGYYGGAGSIQRLLGIPDTVKVYGFDQQPMLSPLVSPFPYMVAPHEQMGYDAVKLLADHPGSRREVREYEYQFFQP